MRARARLLRACEEEEGAALGPGERGVLRVRVRGCVRARARVP